MAKLLIKHPTHENLWLPDVPALHASRNVLWVEYERAMTFDTELPGVSDESVAELARWVAGRVVEVDLGERRLQRLRVVAHVPSHSESGKTYHITFNPNGGMYSCQCKGYHYSRSATPTCSHIREYLIGQNKSWHAQAQR